MYDSDKIEYPMTPQERADKNFAAKHSVIRFWSNLFYVTGIILIIVGLALKTTEPATFETQYAEIFSIAKLYRAAACLFSGILVLTNAVIMSCTLYLIKHLRGY